MTSTAAPAAASAAPAAASAPAAPLGTPRECAPPEHPCGFCAVAVPPAEAFVPGATMIQLMCWNIVHGKSGPKSKQEQDVLVHETAYTKRHEERIQGILAAQGTHNVYTRSVLNRVPEEGEAVLLDLVFLAAFVRRSAPTFMNDMNRFLVHHMVYVCLTISKSGFRGLQHHPRYYMYSSSQGYMVQCVVYRAVNIAMRGIGDWISLSDMPPLCIRALTQVCWSATPAEAAIIYPPEVGQAQYDALVNYFKRARRKR